SPETGDVLLICEGGDLLRSLSFLIITSLTSLLLLFRPQPPKRPRGQQPINQPIYHFLDRSAPRLAFPNAVDDLPQSIRHEASCARHTEHGQVWRARRNRGARQGRPKKAHQQAA